MKFLQNVKQSYPQIRFIVGLITGTFLTASLLAYGVVYAINITVPSAPSSGYYLTSTTTGAYIATTTDPAHFGSVFATSTTATSTLPLLSSTGISTSWLCLNGVCNSNWQASASSTLLSDNNTFSGIDSFTNASSNFAGTWQSHSPSYFQTAIGMGASSTLAFSNGTSFNFMATSSLGLKNTDISGLGTLATLNSVNNSNWSGTALSVGNGGTGNTSFGQGWLYSNGGTGALAASSSPTVAYVTATSTTATSTFAGNLSVSGNTNLASSLNGVLYGTNGMVSSLATSSLGLGASFFQQNGNSFGATAVLGTNDNNALQLKTNNATAMTILGNGNVGIGTTSPARYPAAAGTVLDITGTGVNGLVIHGSGQQISLTDNTNLGAYFDISGAPTASNNFLAFRVTNTNSDYSGVSEVMRITSTGNVGIGTTSPLSKLAVSGGTSIGADYNIAAPANGLIVEGNVGMGVTIPAAKLDVESTVTNTAGTLYNEYAQITGAPTGASSANYVAGYFQSGQVNPQTVTGSLFGIQAITSHQGAATLSNAYGVYVQNQTSGSSGTLTSNDYGLYVDSPTTGASSATTNAYGLYLNPMKQAAVSNGYGVYQNGVSDTNYFAGNVGIGTTSPGTILSVAGAGNFAPTLSTLYSSLTAPYFTATSSTATSTFSGGLSISGGLKNGAETEYPFKFGGGNFATSTLSYSGLYVAGTTYLAIGNGTATSTAVGCTTGGGEQSASVSFNARDNFWVSLGTASGTTTLATGNFPTAMTLTDTYCKVTSGTTATPNLFTVTATIQTN